MKLLVISGGSGNDALIRGLKCYYPDIQCKVLVNAYDNGKSTGVCRAVTDTLGVSDIRKNHYRMYKATTNSLNQSWKEFFESRYDFEKGKEAEQISEKLTLWGLGNLISYVLNFFGRPESKQYEYKDFNVSNIVYSEMYSELGYSYTNSYFCNMLGIDDFVILNSFDNVYIEGVTESGVHLDEGKLVEWKNPEDKIVNLDYVRNQAYVTRLNPEAVHAIKEADYIVISTGTFWSSILPTIEYGSLYQYINESKAKKLWAINCEQDADSYGVSNIDFAHIMENAGLDLSDFTILLNNDATSILRMPDSDYKQQFESMENNAGGKHNSDKYARAVLKYYYGLTDNIEHLLLDFDDTLWKRSDCYAKVNASNVSLLVDFPMDVQIVSGNSYSSIRKKLSTVFGSLLTGFDVPIWANAAAEKFLHNKVVDSISSFLTEQQKSDILNKLSALKLPVEQIDGKGEIPYIKIKPLDETSRILLVELYNQYLRYELQCPDSFAVATGKTTVDILASEDNKSMVAEYLATLQDLSKTLYIGDEVDSGNDNLIATMCGYSIHTSGPEETNCVLRLLK